MNLRSYHLSLDLFLRTHPLLEEPLSSAKTPTDVYSTSTVFLALFYKMIKINCQLDWLGSCLTS